LNYRFRLLLAGTIALAIMFVMTPGPAEGGRLNPAVLHIFLFNLVAGGLVITTRLRGERDAGGFGIAYFLLGVLFALSAALGLAGGSFLAALLLFGLVERLRQRRFGFFPWEFFEPVPASRKFEQASLLCLALALLICAGTMLGQGVLHLPLPAKLDLHVFYLGFSFPLSLQAFSLIFARLEASADPPGRLTGEAAFWLLNLGVIIFFFFIIFGWYPGQMAMALVLLSVVVLVGRRHWRSRREGGWAWLTSGLAFLTLGSLTGIGYVAALWSGASFGAGMRYLLAVHAGATVFGWNLNWVLLTVSPAEPTGRGPARLIALHWLLVLALPLAAGSTAAGATATLLGMWVLDRAWLAGSRPDPRS
jgi:hypothetical protein